MRAVVATIIAKRGLALARALAASLAVRRHALRLVALLADEVEGCFDPAAEPFETIPFDSLAIPHGERLRFRYPQPDLSYALTPWFLGHLLDRGHERVLFLKQESFVVGDLGPLFARLERAPILLTPHLLAPLAGADASAREREVLLAGVYNGGVLGVSDRDEARRFLAWWRERLARHCRLAVGEGMHYEQRWLDFVPTLFPGAVVERHPGANVGHWCLPERAVELRGDEVRADGEPAMVFRFSGFEPARPEAFTRHNRRLEGAEVAAARVVLARYAAALAAAGVERAAAWPCAWTTYDDGVAIPLGARFVYRALDDRETERFGDPFSTAGRRSFRAWLEAPGPGGIARLWTEIHALRADLRRAFPDPRGPDRDAFLAWVRRHGSSEYGAARPETPS